ncbi:MAG: hypothetical protein HY425_01040 [Candidatus Levybacteria bacterium]|nr:hypothetical protein [Candidatus Levybacteria bacterium]
MPDAVVPEIQFKATETLHYGGETTIGGLTPEMQAAKTKASELRKEKAGSANAKSFLESYKNKPAERNLTGQNKEDLNLRFGAGEAKRNASGNIEVPTTPEAKALYDEAQAEIKSINNFFQYVEITAEVKKSGRSISAVLSERTTKGIEGPRSQAEFDTQKEQVLDYLINSEVIQKGLPEVAAITNVAERRKLIEETLAADPTLRTKVVEKMIGIAERIKALPEPAVSKEVKDAEDNKKDSETKITENLDLVRDRLKDIGFDDIRADALRKDVEKYIKDGKSIDQVLGYLRSTSISRLSHVPEIEEYVKASNSIDVLQARLDKFNATTTVPSVVKTTEDQLAAAQKIIDDFNTNTALIGEFNSYQNIIGAFTNQKDSSSSTVEGGIFLSPVAHGIDQIIKSQKTILNADKVIKEKGGQSRKEYDAWKADRLVQESNLIAEMKNILPSSIAETLSDRYDEMVTLEKQRMARVAKEEEEKGNKAVADGIRKIEQAKEKKWIEYNPTTRKREIHTAALGDDLKYAAYGGEDAVKRLIFRDSDIRPSGLVGPVDYRTIDFNTLPEDTKKILEGVYENQKESYKQKLFGDFFLGKNFINRRVFGIQLGELALKKHEYELLQKNFGETFQKGIESKAEAKAAMEKLKASGIKVNGGLFFLLALLFGAPFLVAKKALGIGQ